MRSRDVGRLWDVLMLEDDRLIAALGGSRREELRGWNASFQSSAQALPDGVERICRHCERYPSAMKGHSLAPHELHIVGGARQLAKVLSAPVVAIVGTRRCTDYGMEIARSLGRELAAAGVSVIGELSDGISYGAHTGTLEAGGKGLGVLGAGVDRCSPQCCTALYRRMGATGCLISELPCGVHPRRWSQLARARTLVLLAELVIVVEASEHPRELACAGLAQAFGKKLGAVPGRVGSRASLGPNRLVKEGAVLVRGAQDALDLLYGVKQWTPPQPDLPPLDPRLRSVLEQIGEGNDTLPKLSARRESTGAVLRALAELELRGLVVRGDGGRYLPSIVTARR